jgi:hypothetical protein
MITKQSQLFEITLIRLYFNPSLNKFNLLTLNFESGIINLLFGLILFPYPILN